MMNFTYFIIILILLSTCIYSVFVPINIYKGYVPIKVIFTNNIYDNIRLWITRILHLAAVLFFVTYILIYDKPTYDSIYLIFLIIMVSHWYVRNNECVLDCHEKRILDKTYICGTTKSNLYLKILNIPKILEISMIFTMISLIIIIYRSPIINNVFKVIIIFIILYINIISIPSRFQETSEILF
jgi:hypothetical protein